MTRQDPERARRLTEHDEAYRARGYDSLAGVDEAGRGPWAGPVVASAVIVREFLFTARIDDSKKMTPAAREAAYGEILAKCWVGVGEASVEEIDRINILEATHEAMRRAVSALGRTPDALLVDGNRTPWAEMPRFAIVDGDAKSLAIACASIVAKVTRDRQMVELDRLYPAYGFARHKGYGTREHQAALEAHGPSPVHRRSFGPVRRLIAS